MGRKGGLSKDQDGAIKKGENAGVKKKEKKEKENAKWVFKWKKKKRIYKKTNKIDYLKGMGKNNEVGKIYFKYIFLLLNQVNELSLKAYRENAFKMLRKKSSHSYASRGDLTYKRC